MRAWRLANAEPALRTAYAAMREEFRQQTITHLGEVLQADQFELDVLLDLWTSTPLAARLEWAAAQDAGEPAELDAIYDRAVTQLRRLTPT